MSIRTTIIHEPESVFGMKAYLAELHFMSTGFSSKFFGRIGTIFVNRIVPKNSGNYNTTQRIGHISLYAEHASDITAHSTNWDIIVKQHKILNRVEKIYKSYGVI